MGNNGVDSAKFKEIEIFLNYMIVHNKKHLFDMQEFQRKLAELDPKAGELFLSSIGDFDVGIKKMEEAYKIIEKLGE